MTPEFEQHVRCLMATGSTARQTRESLLLNAGHFLGRDEGAAYCGEVPQPAWFVTQREALGVESLLYTFMRIAACERVQQWGFDETTIDGHEVFYQWAMLIDQGMDGDDKAQGGATAVTLECAGVLPNAEAIAVVQHIQNVWERGKMLDLILTLCTN
jgi:hypothetical protein